MLLLPRFNYLQNTKRQKHKLLEYIKADAKRCFHCLFSPWKNTHKNKTDITCHYRDFQFDAFRPSNHEKFDQNSFDYLLWFTTCWKLIFPQFFFNKSKKRLKKPLEGNQIYPTEDVLIFKVWLGFIPWVCHK